MHASRSLDHSRPLARRLRRQQVIQHPHRRLRHRGKLVGATSVDVLGELSNGRPTMQFPDPANPGKTGAFAVAPRDHCKITPTGTD
jgi:hypothetical protein